MQTTIIKREGDQTLKLSEERHLLWLARIAREVEPTVFSKVCSDHFVQGKPSTLYDKTNPDWAPSIKLRKTDKGGITSAKKAVMSMKAVTVRGSGGPVFETSYPKPVRKNKEALVKVLRAGLCKTDIEILKGYMGFSGVLGHEFVGIIEDIDDNSHNLRIGDRVVGEINLACERCSICQGGGIAKRNHCPERSALGIFQKDGTFAEYLTIPVSNLYHVPKPISDEVAAFAEPLAAAYRIVEQVSFIENSSKKVAVIGDGKLGNLIAQVLSFEADELTVFGKHLTKLERIPQSNVTKVLVDSSSTAKEYGNQFDVCVEASGTPNGLMMAASITRPLGTVVLKSTCAADASAGFNTTDFVVKELTILGSRCGNFQMALQGLESGRIKVTHLIDHVYPFDQALEAIDRAGTKGVMKVQLCMGGQ